MEMGDSNSRWNLCVTGISYRPQIPSGYTMIPAIGYYRPSTKPLPWLEARDTCAAEGAVLATPSSEREATVIAKEFPFNATSDIYTASVWVGLHDSVQEGKFVSIEGT